MAIAAIWNSPPSSSVALGPGAEDAMLTEAELRQRLAALQESQALLQARQQVDQALAGLSAPMRWQPDDTLGAWANRVLEALAEQTQALQACLYIREHTEQAQMLSLAGTYAAGESHAQTSIRWGEGPLGQVAKSGRALLLGPEASIEAHASTGLAQIKPQSLLLLPLIYNQRLEGVLELATTTVLAGPALDIVKRLSENLAANLMSIQSQDAMRRLLQEAQDKSQQLATQEEEMRQNLAELQATQEEMRRVQQNLALQQHIINQVLDSNKDLILVKDASFRCMYVNESYAKSLNAAKAQLVGKNDVEMGYTPDEVFGVPEKGINGFRQEDELVLQGHSFHNPHAPAGDTILDTLKQPLLDAQGQIVGIIIHLRDVTALKNQEKELNRREAEMAAAHAETKALRQEFELMASQLKGMLFTYVLYPETGQLGFTYVSPRCEALFGKPQDELIKLSPSPQESAVEIHSEDIERFQVSVSESAMNLTPYRTELRLMAASGRFEWFIVEANPTLSEDSKVVWYGYLTKVG